MMEKVSIIVTCYNHEAYIEQCIRSIFGQTHRNIELLVINDGSTDNSDEIINGIISETPFDRTEYVVQENQGICATRNKGLDWIDCEFALFVDSDNYLDSDYVEELLKTALNQEADIIYTDLVDADTGKVFMEAKDFDFQTYLSGNFIDNCSLLRTSKIRNVKYDMKLNRKKLVDYDFLLNLVISNQAKPFKCSKTKLNYRVLNDSISRKNNHSSEKFYYEVYLYILTKYLKTHQEEIVQAVKKNIFYLEDRLDDLINHLSDVTLYVKNLENNNRDLSGNILELKNFYGQLELRSIELEKMNSILEASNKNFEDRVSELENDKNLILNSMSYRLGNIILKPFSYSKKVVKNPKLIKVFLGKVKRRNYRLLGKVPNPKKALFSIIRNFKRVQNNYSNPKRVLIYVIYEDKERLQTYKIIFLDALAALSNRVLIVVNGNLPEKDIEIISKYGEVVFRENQGYDTAAFRHGIQYFGKEGLANYDELLLVNDTNVGPMFPLETIFERMGQKKLDFWGISYGEEQVDFTQYNKYKYIPVHLQSYFLVIEKNMFSSNSFFKYWEELKDTDSRNKAIGKHETVFTKHFEELGFKHGALTQKNQDSPMYIHPLTMIKEGVPFVKYTAFANYTNDKFAWQGLLRETEVPALLDYIDQKTDYPMEVIDTIMFDIKNKKHKEHILIIDGVENAIPQLTKYRVENKIEQLESLGYKVWHVNLSGFQMGYAEYASHIIVYRAGYTEQLAELCRLAQKYEKPVLYDIDDLVIDTKYTDQLTYTQEISEIEKLNYDAGVKSYGKMLKLCDGAITTTTKLKEELLCYKDKVLLNRNLANQKLVEISNRHLKDYSLTNKIVKIGYFSGSITHNENFELIKAAILKILEKHPSVELHLVGHLDIPKDLSKFKKQIKTHNFVEWQQLPQLISQVDINLAPLVNSIFNQAKSEIKWIEASLVKVPTVASNIGAFAEMIKNNETGILANDDDWYRILEELISSLDIRKRIADRAYDFVIHNCITLGKQDQLTDFIKETLKIE